MPGELKLVPPTLVAQAPVPRSPQPPGVGPHIQPSREWGRAFPSPQLSEAALERESFRLMAESSVDVLCRITLDVRCTYCSPSCLRVFGWTTEEMKELFPRDLTHPDDIPIVKAAHARLLHEEGCDNSPATTRVRRKDGSYLWAEVNSRLMRDPVNNAPWQVLLNLRDISERKLLEEKLEQLTLTDSMTRLGNRRAFDDALHREWSRALHNGIPLSLLFLDVDRFKHFNDSYGHQVGDDCLCILAGCIAKLANRPGDLAARYGGEEMALLLPGTDALTAARIADDLRSSIQALHLPHRENIEHGSHVTVSIGVATALSHLGGRANTCTGLLQAADSALYKAKHNGRNRVESSLLLTPPALEKPASPSATPETARRFGPPATQHSA